MRLDNDVPKEFYESDDFFDHSDVESDIVEDSDQDDQSCDELVEEPDCDDDESGSEQSCDDQSDSQQSCDDESADEESDDERSSDDDMEYSDDDTAENILRVKPGPTSFATRSVGDIVSSVRLFLDDNILDHIRECTAKEAQRVLQDDSWEISKDELLAFIAICYARGALGLKNMSVTNIFSTKYGPELIRGTMSREKFKTIMRFLRFDDKETRLERLVSDKFALMSFVWNNFIENCKKCYNPGANLTVDEQLFPMKTRCPFTQFMKDKPDKFGVKFFLAVDVDSKYILNGFPYTGPDEKKQNQPAGERVVLKLMKPYFGGGYNVTTDNFFTGLDLAVALKEKKITLVGTANKKRRWVPETAKLKNPKLPLYESNIYLGPNQTTLTLYQGKRNKSVSILSSLHKSVKITKSAKKKPETIQFYNQTKYGVDVADQMAKKYSTKASSRRWPVQIFYNILDLAGINAWIIYKNITGKSISRLKFILELAESLRRPYLSDKNLVASQKNNALSNGLLTRNNNEIATIDTTQQRNISLEINSSNLTKCCCSKIQPKRQHCQTKKCNNKSSTKCFDCKKIICGKCTSYEQHWCFDCCPHICSK